MNALRFFHRAAYLWRSDIHAYRDLKAHLAMSDHMLRDIGMSRHEIVTAFVQERAGQRERS
jgi:uncharacterized protein YjiS (DUF1127 family)